MCSTLSYNIIGLEGARSAFYNTMVEEMPKRTYECPSSNVIELCFNDGVLQITSPVHGGNEDPVINPGI